MLMGEESSWEGAVPRQPRVFVDGAVYHVYCRVGRGEAVFRNQDEAESLIRVLGEVKRRDDFKVLAWCIMSNHYHLVLRCGQVPLWRTMRLIQGRYAKDFNRRQRVYGPLWQGRYKAKLVMGARYLQQVIVYAHLNPSAAGGVRDPAMHAWSGHRELLGTGDAGLVDVDEALVAFGETREAAVRTYVQALRSAKGAPWLGREPGRLPWWTNPGRNETPEPTGNPHRLDALGASSAPERRLLAPDEYLVAAVNALDIDLDSLAGPRSGREMTRMREMVALVGVEAHGVRVKDLAQRLGRNPGVVSRWASGGSERRARDDAFGERIGQFAADVRALTTPAPHDESDFVSGMAGSFID
jgi:putative transposase